VLDARAAAHAVRDEGELLTGRDVAFAAAACGLSGPHMRLP
jgi:hypothetical protein